jgi:hypothetical protein
MNPYKYKISLRIRHPSMNPDEISKTLGLTPKRQWSTGASKVTPKGLKLKGYYGSSYCWFPLSIPSKSTLEEGTISWLQKLEKHEDFFKNISATGGSTEFLIVWFVKGNAGEVFDWLTLAKLSSLRVNLAFDIY